MPKDETDSKDAPKASKGRKSHEPRILTPAEALAVEQTADPTINAAIAAWLNRAMDGVLTWLVKDRKLPIPEAGIPVLAGKRAILYGGVTRNAFADVRQAPKDGEDVQKKRGGGKVLCEVWHPVSALRRGRAVNAAARNRFNKAALTDVKAAVNLLTTTTGLGIKVAEITRDKTPQAGPPDPVQGGKTPDPPDGLPKDSKVTVTAPEVIGQKYLVGPRTRDGYTYIIVNNTLDDAVTIIMGLVHAAVQALHGPATVKVDKDGKLREQRFNGAAIQRMMAAAGFGTPYASVVPLKPVDDFARALAASLGPFPAGGLDVALADLPKADGMAVLRCPEWRGWMDAPDNAGKSKAVLMKNNPHSRVRETRRNPDVEVPLPLCGKCSKRLEVEPPKSAETETTVDATAAA